MSSLRGVPVGAGLSARTYRLRRAGHAALAALLTAASAAGVVAAVVIGVVIAVVVATAGPAAAHNVLLESRPDDGDRLEQGPAEITLRFNEDAQEDYGSVVVTGPGGGQWQDGELGVSGATVTQPLRPLGPAGTYDVSWRVISADGHPVSGTFSFAVSSEGSGTALPASEEVGSAEEDLGWWWLTVGLVAGALALAAAVLIIGWKLSRRGRTRRSAR